MLRYHKNVFFPKDDIKRLEDLTGSLNNKHFGYTEHCLENLKYRALDMEGVLIYMTLTIFENMLYL